MMNGHLQSRRKIFGVRITEAGARDIAQRIMRLRPERVELVVTPNIDHVVHLRRNVRFARAYRNAAIVVCDGFPVRYYAVLNGVAVQRVTGSDILEELMASPLCGHRLFFVVDSEETAEAVRDWARGTKVAVKTAIPPFKFERNQDYCGGLVRQINEHRTSILVMGVGAPKSEIWVDTHRGQLPPCWTLCVGQAVRTACGVTRRAPVLVQRLNGEWLWRMCQEPGRLWWRYLRGVLVFPLAIVEDQLNNWLGRLAWRKAEAPFAADTPDLPRQKLVKRVSRLL
jgi:N-acetylglucosaminyldiphosphoundecaprenol N-acetyl-beta-D-mannosaminyltransferase